MTPSMKRRSSRGAEEFRAHGDSVTARLLFSRAIRWFAAHPKHRSREDAVFGDGVALFSTGALESAAVRFGPLARDTLDVNAAGFLGVIAAGRSDRAQARAIADSIGRVQRRWLLGDNTYWRAAILGTLGERDAAVELLGTSDRERRRMTRWHLATELTPLHGFPAFQALIAVRH